LNVFRKEVQVMSRKAQALPMNTVIIAILVVLVLFVVGAFFLGGTSGVSKFIRGFFYDTIAGQDRVTAVGICKARCDSLEILPQSSWTSSAYCKESFSIDENNDGEAEFDMTGDVKQYDKYYCYPRSGDESLDVPCPQTVTIPNADGTTTEKVQSPSEYCLQKIQTVLDSNK